MTFPFKKKSVLNSLSKPLIFSQITSVISIDFKNSNVNISLSYIFEEFSSYHEELQNQ